MSTHDLLPGTFELLILRSLSLQPMHGYAIAQHLKRVGRDKLRVEEGSLYPALQRLLAKGWVKAAWVTSSTGRRVREYTLTTLGKKQLGAETERFTDLLGAIQRVMRES